MAMLKTTGEIEGVSGGRYQRCYLPTALTSDSQYPFSPGQKVRYQLVETNCGYWPLVVVPETLEVDQEVTDLEMRRSAAEVQTDLEKVGDD